VMLSDVFPQDITQLGGWCKNRWFSCYYNRSSWQHQHMAALKGPVKLYGGG
jgi:hypothetical protein